MTQELLRGFKEASALPPPGARERVWRRLDSPRRPAAALPWLALAGAAAAAVIAFVTLTPRAAPPLVPMYGEGYVVLAPAGALTRSGDALVLRHGTAFVSAWGGRVELVWGRRRVSTDAAVFAASVASDVSLAVQSGAVLADGERVEASPRATAVDFAPLRALEPKEAEQERAWVLAENAAAEGRIAEAIERFAALSAYSSLRAEAALLRKAQLELWSLHAPADALRTLAAAAERFPAGALQQERAFSELEAYVEQKAWRAAAERAASFLTAWPQSERRAEVEQVAAVAATSIER